MRRAMFTSMAFAALVAASGTAFADKAKDLPAGPILDRHELMEGIGGNAKKIGDALKSGNHEPIAKAAEDIQTAAGNALPLFPKDSLHPNSRAKPEIWQDWAKFEELMKGMEAKAGELASAAKSGGDAGAAANAMFGNCKSCHDSFRKPEEKK
jgi:cytochrome c556